ncbi:MAG: amidinotransferase [Gemmatimonadetes bacterium]|nr:MAG: amidinotransferase [Gemmatimonadota bacterium]
MASDFNFTKAIVRTPAPTFAAGLTTVSLGTPDYDQMLDQHRAYVQALRDFGLNVTVLDPLPAFPDAHFVEDVAVIVPEVAVITRPGAASRLGEVEYIEPVLRPYRTLAYIQAPGTLDGGDVLVVADQVFVGLSKRTNQAGAQQLLDILRPYGYRGELIPIPTGLHLKANVNYVGQNTLLLTASFAEQQAFAGFRHLILPEEEAYAANTLLINGYLLTPAGFPQTRALLQSLNMPLLPLAMSEAHKMDGGLTCLSLRF